MKNNNRGFALLVAVIFMTVMLSFALSLGSLGYKQQILASAAKDSQVAFYAADAALECVLLEDQNTETGSLFAYKSPITTIPTFNCDGNGPITSPALMAPSAQVFGSGSAMYDKYSYYFSFDNSTRCANVTIYKYQNPQPQPVGDPIATYIFSQGYNVSCDAVQANAVRYASRGLQTHY